MGSWQPKFLPSRHSLKNSGKEGNNTQQGAICRLCGPGVMGSFQSELRYGNNQPWPGRLSLGRGTAPLTVWPPAPAGPAAAPGASSAPHPAVQGPPGQRGFELSGQPLPWSSNNEPAPVAGPASTQGSGWVIYSSIHLPTLLTIQPIDHTPILFLLPLTYPPTHSPIHPTLTHPLTHTPITHLPNSDRSSYCSKKVKTQSVSADGSLSAGQ